MKNNRKTVLLALVLLSAGWINARAQTSTPTKSLSESQLKSIKSIESASEKKAVPLAMQLAKTAKQIYENMLAPRESQQRRMRLSRQLYRLTNELLAIKGQSIREVIAVLTPPQKELLREEMHKPDQPADLIEVFKRVFKAGS